MYYYTRNWIRSVPNTNKLGLGARFRKVRTEEKRWAYLVSARCRRRARNGDLGNSRRAASSSSAAAVAQSSPLETETDSALEQHGTRESHHESERGKAGGPEGKAANVPSH